MNPKHVVLSVGKKPDTDAQQKYKSHTENVFSTRFHGTIMARCWEDGDVWLYDYCGTRIG